MYSAHINSFQVGRLLLWWEMILLISSPLIESESHGARGALSRATQHMPTPNNSKFCTHIALYSAYRIGCFPQPQCTCMMYNLYENELWRNSLCNVIIMRHLQLRMSTADINYVTNLENRSTSCKQCTKLVTVHETLRCCLADLLFD